MTLEIIFIAFLCVLGFYTYLGSLITHGSIFKKYLSKRNYHMKTCIEDAGFSLLNPTKYWTQREK